MLYAKTLPRFKPESTLLAQIGHKPVLPPAFSAPAANRIGKPVSRLRLCDFCRKSWCQVCEIAIISTAPLNHRNADVAPISPPISPR